MFRHKNPYSDSEILPVLCSLPRQLLRLEVRKSLGISAPTSQQVQMEILTASEVGERFFFVWKHRDFLICPSSKISSTTEPN